MLFRVFSQACFPRKKRNGPLLDSNGGVRSFQVPRTDCGGTFSLSDFQKQGVFSFRLHFSYGPFDHSSTVKTTSAVRPLSWIFPAIDPLFGETKNSRQLERQIGRLQPVKFGLEKNQVPLMDKREMASVFAQLAKKRVQNALSTSPSRRTLRRNEQGCF